VLLTLILYLLAFLWNKVSIAKAAICGAAAVAVFVLVQPIVIHGRNVLIVSGDTQASLARRLEILLSYSAEDAAAVNPDELQSSLARISYVNAATFVIRQYDIGIPGDWPKLLPAVFVPRLLWPEKPNITDIGLDIYELGTGSRASSMGAGVFADAYWAMGWWGVLVYMPIYGLILGVLTLNAARVLREHRWLFFPVVLVAIVVGFRTDGHYIADVAGASVILAGMYIVLVAVDRLLAALSAPTPGTLRIPRAATAVARSSPPKGPIAKFDRAGRQRQAL
jgi:hypothetical protein